MTESASSSRLWSWEALRRPELQAPGSPRRAALGTVFLPYTHPRGGRGVVGIRPPTRQELAQWLFGPAAFLHPEWQSRPATRRLAAAVDGVDRARASARRAGSPPARRRAAALARRYDRLLLAALYAGLERRVGDALVGSDQSVFVHLAARCREPTAVRVCEQCGVVFRAPRAKRCGDCCRRPVKIRLHAGHTQYQVGDRFDPDSLRVHYWGECDACGGEFHSTDSRRRLCLNCGGSSGRVRRHRGGSRTGRQCFRFRGSPELQTISFAFGPSGRTVKLDAVEGVVETEDAEVAHYVAENFAHAVRPIG